MLCASSPYRMVKGSKRLFIYFKLKWICGNMQRLPLLNTKSDSLKEYAIENFDLSTRILCL